MYFSVFSFCLYILFATSIRRRSGVPTLVVVLCVDCCFVFICNVRLYERLRDHFSQRETKRFYRGIFIRHVFHRGYPTVGVVTCCCWMHVLNTQTFFIPTCIFINNWCETILFFLFCEICAENKTKFLNSVFLLTISSIYYSWNRKF